MSASNPRIQAPLDVEWYGYGTNLIWDSSLFVTDSLGDPYPYFLNTMTYSGDMALEIGEAYEVQLQVALGYSEANGVQTNPYATIRRATLIRR